MKIAALQFSADVQRQGSAALDLNAVFWQKFYIFAERSLRQSALPGKRNLFAERRRNRNEKAQRIAAFYAVYDFSPFFRLFAAPIAACISRDGIMGLTVPPPARKAHRIALCAADLLGGRVTAPFNAAFSI